MGESVVPEYAVFTPGQVPCEHLVMAPLGNGDHLPCRRLPAPCDRCWDRFVSMVTIEVESVLDQRRDGRAFVYRAPGLMT